MRKTVVGILSEEEIKTIYKKMENLKSETTTDVFLLYSDLLYELYYQENCSWSSIEEGFSKLTEVTQVKMLRHNQDMVDLQNRVNMINAFVHFHMNRLDNPFRKKAQIKKIVYEQLYIGDLPLLLQEEVEFILDDYFDERERWKWDRSMYNNRRFA